MKKKLPLWARLIFAVLTPAALFYLFVVPMMAALAPNDGGVLGVVFGAFMLLQLFLLVAVQAYESAAAFYGMRPPKLLRFLLEPPTAGKYKVRHGGYAIFSMFLSYAMLGYAFGVLYVYVSHVDPGAFSVGALGAFEGWYFSVLTGATVAFGDIIPKSVPARVAVILQVSLSIFYVVLLFSASSSYLAARKRRPTRSNGSPLEAGSVPK